jgi:hypothetical protein
MVVQFRDFSVSRFLCLIGGRREKDWLHLSLSLSLSLSLFLSLSLSALLALSTQMLICMWKIILWYMILHHATPILPYHHHTIAGQSHNSEACSSSSLPKGKCKGGSDTDDRHVHIHHQKLLIEQSVVGKSVMSFSFCRCPWMGNSSNWIGDQMVQGF